MEKIPPHIQAARRALGDFLREERHRRDMSQEDFAELCGVHRNYIGYIERAELSMSFDNLHEIAAAIKLKPSQLLAKAGL